MSLQLSIVTERWDDDKEEFVYDKPIVLQLEHSLVSLSKWEAKWHKPYLSPEPHTREETLDYIRCMTITQNVPKDTYQKLTTKHFKEVNDYINDSMTATWFSKQQKQSTSSEQVTSELIYYWMVSFGIPFECQKWHLNRLLTLIRVCSLKNQKPEKMSKEAILRQNDAINRARRQKYRTKG